MRADPGASAGWKSLSARLESLRSVVRLIWRPTNVPAVLALFVIVLAGFFAEHQNRRVFEQSLRSEVLSSVGVIRAKIEGNVNGNIQLVRGLVATLTTEPNMRQHRFAQLAANLLSGDSQLRTIAGAPDLVLSLIYPLAGNEKAIGLDYRKNDAQREAALRARDTGDLILAGPVDLVQGGQGFIGRFPVFIETRHGVPSFWGIVSAVIDRDRLYRESGLLDPKLPIDIALMGHDGSGAAGQRFYGDESVTSNNPVTARILLPTGSWQIAAVPKGGWDVTPPNTWTLRLLIFVAGALIMVPTVMTGRLIEERSDNISELRRREIELERLSRRLGLALNSSHIGVWELNTGDNSLLWDDRMNELYGRPADGGPRTYADWERAIHPEDLARVLTEFPTALAAGGSYQTQYRLLLDGEVRHVRESAKVYQDPGEPPRIVGVNWDVTADVELNESLKQANMLTEARNVELEAAKGRIEFNALHDSLTGLPNRRYLDDVLAAHIDKAHGEGERAGLLHIDLDRFKQINDTLGHAAGDAMLRYAAKVLTSNLRQGDFVARVGGDEFVVLCKADRLDEAVWNERLARLADRIIEQMHQPVPYEGHECRFGVSIGIASDLEAGTDPRRLLVNADLALYRAKSRGRNRYQFFNEALQAEIVSTKRIADDILSGLERNEFVAYYQPQFDAATHAVIGVEALARWNHPTEGLLAPASFMKIAEELNVVGTIDRMILEQTLRNFNEWTASGLDIPKASVNVSARRLHDEELIRSLRKLRIKPGTISFELVESIFLDENDELVTWNVEQIKNLGIDIEIDDFGTGYASIVSLLKLKPRRLKIDRQLIIPLLRAPGQRQLVGSIIDIGRSLGIEVLAEGVETMGHAKVLEGLGCHALQGHAFAHAMSAAQLKNFVLSRKLRAAS
ncbi:bifunctional diguanylate cyclase/phosphodiesterase [Mesorhizobium sp. 10J20-29]